MSNTPQPKGLSEPQQKRFEGYYQQLEKCEQGALANELAMIFLFVPLLPVDKILDQAAENTRILRRNRKVILERKKVARLKTLSEKPRLTKPEMTEFAQLCKQLKIEVTK